jgi:hypothetical protein
LRIPRGFRELSYGAVCDYKRKKIFIYYCKHIESFEDVRVINISRITGVFF